MEVRRAQNQLDIIRKQMIAVEICRDLQKIQTIIAGLLYYDSTNEIEGKFDRAHIFANDNFNNRPEPLVKYPKEHDQKNFEQCHCKARPLSGGKNKEKELPKKSNAVGSTLTRKEAIQKRQEYRRQFREHIMIGIRDKYSKQMGLLYAGDENKLKKNIYKGASMDMERDPKDYGIQARTHLLKIASLMIKHNIKLTHENFFDPCHFPSHPKDKPRGKRMGLLGWLIELSAHDEIRNEMNRLINLVLD